MSEPTGVFATQEDLVKALADNQNLNRKAVHDMLLKVSPEERAMLSMCFAQCVKDEDMAAYYHGLMSTAIFYLETLPDMEAGLDAILESHVTPAPEKRIPLEQEIAAEWNLTWIPEGHPNDPWQCVCGMRYVSVQDRALRPKGIAGCHGCQNKSANG